MRKFAAKAAFLFLISLFAISLTTSNAVAATVVNSNNMNGWVGVDPADFVLGPTGQPAGNGSVNLADKSIHRSFLNTELSDITALKYFAHTDASQAQPVLVIQVSTNLGPDVLSFNPHFQTNQVAQSGAWQEWDTLSPTGIWNSQSFTICDNKNFVDYINCVGDFNPIMTDDTGDGTNGLKFKTGPGVQGNVDNFTIGINGSDTTFDFEPDQAPPATNTFAGNFFSDPNFGTPAGDPISVAGQIFRKNLGLGSPSVGVPADNFSMRVEGTYDFETANYRFTLSSDGLVRVYVDDVLLVDNSTLGRGPAQAIYQATEGVHEVRVEYVHGTGSSFVSMHFFKTNECYDMDGNNKIASADLGIIAGHFGADGLTPWDIDGNGNVGAADLGLVSSKFGKSCPYI